MTFDLSDAYVWDFWTVYDAVTGRQHLFYLHAPRSLGDPELRHRHARIGHAVSEDLVTWTPLPAPLPGPAVSSFDDLASWTGCTVHAGEEWWLFSTGLCGEDDGLVQRIGSARSSDALTWTRTGLVLGADPAYYQRSSPAWPEEAWRDPWVVQDDGGTWHMYVTARDRRGDLGCGVVGHAVSTDLRHWEVAPPLSSPTGIFEWLEVIQVVQVEGRWVLLFSCLGEQMPRAVRGAGGVWSVPVDGPGAQVDVAAAVRLCDESLYVGKVVEHAGSAYFMAFRNQGPAGEFLGGLSSPVPVTWRADGRGLALASTGSEP